MDVGSYDSWASLSSWSMPDASSDPSMLMMSSGSDPLAVPMPTQGASSIISPPPASALGLTDGSAGASTLNTQPSLVSQSSVSVSRRASVAATVAEATPSFSTFDERIAPPEELAQVIDRQQRAESFSSWYASSPVLITHHCWFELLRPQRLSRRDSPSVQSAAAKPESQDSGIGSLRSDPLLGDSPAPSPVDDSFELSPLEGYLGSSYLFQQWLVTIQDSSFKVSRCGYCASYLHCTCSVSAALLCHLTHRVTSSL